MRPPRVTMQPLAPIADDAAAPVIEPVRTVPADEPQPVSRARGTDLPPFEPKSEEEDLA